MFCALSVFIFSSDNEKKAMKAVLSHIRRSTSTAKGNVIIAGLYLLGVIVFIMILEPNALHTIVALFCMFMAGVHSVRAFQEGVM
jgi:hypothetical protein